MAPMLGKTTRPGFNAWVFASTVGALTLANAGAGAGPLSGPASDTPAASLTIPVERFELANGLEVLVHRDPTLPLVAVNLWYHVGPSVEPPGRSGFAHLFEHLMFAGSRHVGDRYDELLEEVGATNVNGTTSWDRTAYFATVPREHLARVLWIESDRMGFMLEALTEERLRVQQGVVTNERRQSYENAPYGPSTLALFDTLFPPGHPYHGAIIGSIADVQAATLADVRRFFERYYAPSNATLALAGDVDLTTARELVSRYFGTLPTRPRPPRPGHPTPPLASPSRQVIHERIELPRVAIAWLAPPAFGPDDAPLEVATTILAGGRATRLYRALVTERQLATVVSAYVDANELATIVSVRATARQGVEATELERELAATVARLGREGPTDVELARAQRRILLELAKELQALDGGSGESGRAGLLQRFNHYLDDPNALPRYTTSIAAVTSDDVARVVSRHLAPCHAATVVTLPESPPRTVASP